jgi:hypothetical protein
MAFKSPELSQTQTPSSLIISLKYDQNIEFQTVHNFGASVCSSIQMADKYYPESRKEKIAELLFSEANQQDNSLKGIGFSIWQFKIDTGSTEQGKGRKAKSIMTIVIEN